MISTEESDALEYLLNFLEMLDIKAAGSDYMPESLGHDYMDMFLSRMYHKLGIGAEFEDN